MPQQSNQPNLPECLDAVYTRLSDLKQQILDGVEPAEVTHNRAVNILIAVHDYSDLDLAEWELDRRALDLAQAHGDRIYAILLYGDPGEPDYVLTDYDIRQFSAAAIARIRNLANHLDRDFLRCGRPLPPLTDIALRP